MSAKSAIEWTDATWNPVTGCSKVSAGCKHCYAERDWARLAHLPAFAGRAFTDVACHTDRLDQPLRWKKPRRVFVNSMSDLFHEAVPEDFILAAFVSMAAARQHTYQVLTKRPARMRDLLTRWKAAGLVLREGCGAELRNVWLGVSVEDQKTADERIPLLLGTPAAVRWISAEPLLGPVALTCIGADKPYYIDALRGVMRSTAPISLDPSPPEDLARVDWVVAGGESGPKARPMNPVWARFLRDQCAAAGVPFLHKQNGEWAPADLLPEGTALPASHWAKVTDHGETPYTTRQDERFGGTVPGFAIMGRIGKAKAGRLLDGVLHDAYPATTGGAA